MLEATRMVARTTDRRQNERAQIVEDALMNCLVGLMAGTIRTHELPPALLAILGWGNEKLHERIAELERENDRLYAEVCRRQPPREEHQSYADLSRIRGEEDRAQRHEQRMAEIDAEMRGAR